MTPSASGSRVAGKLGLTDRIFAGSAVPQAAVGRRRPGSPRVDRALERELRVTDALADAASRYLYEAGGKRVRPMLALITAQLGDGANDDVIDGATALEMTHLGSLYHDDVMDAADKRRGVPSAHAVWGNSVAILTGDLLFSRASQIMARQGDRAIRLQADTFERLVLGQMHETVGPQEGEDRVAFYLKVLSDKTGSLIAAAAQSGIIFSNGPAEFEEPLVTFGEKVGVAFQLLDDVIDLSADPDETGKVPGTDLRAGRADDALPRARAADGCRHPSPCATRIDEGVERIADGADPAILDDELAELREHEATEATLDLAHAWSSEAVEALAPLPDGAVREALTRFAQAVADRSS